MAETFSRGNYRMQYLLAIIANPSILLAQAQFRKVDPQLTHERIIAIVPMVGAGTAKNPKHPVVDPLFWTKKDPFLR